MLHLMLACLAQVPLNGPEGPIFSNPSTLNTSEVVMPNNGATVKSSLYLCDQLTPSERVGTWYCLQGDGGTLTGSQVSFVASGTTSVGSAAVCPNGPNCASKAALRVQASGGAHGWSEPSNVNRNTSVSTGGFTACWEGQPNSLSAEREVQGLSTNGVAAAQFMTFSSSGTWKFYISNSPTCASFTALDSTRASINGAHHLACLTWAASDGIYRTYVDGVAGAASSSFTSICGGGATSRHAVGGYWSAAITASMESHTFGAFYTQTQLSAARIAELATLVLANSTTSTRSNPVAFTRATVSTCLNKDNGWYGSALTSGNFCVARGGYMHGNPAATNLAIRSEEIDNLAWADVAVGAAAPTLNGANSTSAYSPLYTYTMEDYTFQATNAGQTSGRNNVAAAGCSAVQCAYSIFVMGVGASGTLDLCARGASVTCTPCTVTNGVVTRCETTQTITTPGLFIGNDTANNGGTTRAQLRVLVWGGQVEVGNHATAYIPTTASSAARNGEAATVSLPEIVGDVGSAAITYMPDYTGSPGTCGSVCGPQFFGGDSNTKLLYEVSSNMRTYDGTNNPSVNMNSTRDTAKQYCSRWSAGGWNVYNVTDALSASSSFSGTLFGGNSTLQFLSASGGFSSGWWKNVCFSRTSSCCP